MWFMMIGLVDWRAKVSSESGHWHVVILPKKSSSVLDVESIKLIQPIEFLHNFGLEKEDQTCELEL